MSKPLPDPQILTLLRQGVVIPAHPLALNSKRKLDERRQRALTRYYADAGAGGLAIGVHTTQFEIRESKFGLYKPVLTLAAETMAERESSLGRRLIKVAGIAGKTKQAVAEAELAAELGYHLGLVSLGAMRDISENGLVRHLNAISEIIPVFGFYLQPSVGGIRLDYSFWRRALEIENLVAIKVAPFNRYETLDVARAVVDAGRNETVSLYTGNDDNILIDLLTVYRFGENSQRSVSFRGGLLGQWAVWTRKAVEDLRTIQRMREDWAITSPTWLTMAQQLTDANAAIFDTANGFAGCIPGIHEVLRRQGLLEGRWTLNPQEELSPGQMEAIDRVYASYPSLNDDIFVKENLDRWLS